MIGLSNNTYSTLILSVLILLLPSFALMWIAIAGEITLGQRVIFGGLGLLFLLANFYINFLIFNIYYNYDRKSIVVKRLGRIMYETSSFDIDVQSTNWYGMSLANFILVLNGKKFRFRSKVVRFGFFEWLDRRDAARKVSVDMMNTIASCATPS